MDSELIKGTLALVILSLLSREPKYGYQIASTVARETDGDFDWKAGSLYPSLHKLEKTGLIRGEWHGEPEGRRRKYYYLTEAGKKTLEEKTAAWNSITRAVNRILEKS